MGTSEVLTKEFCATHGIEPAAVIPPVSRAIAMLMSVHEALADEVSSAVQTRPTWAMFWRMGERAAEHAMGMLSLWCTGFPAQAEVVSRSTFEHSITLRYVLDEGNHERLVACLQHFVRGEATNIDRLPLPRESPERVARERALVHRRGLVRQLAQELGLDPAKERAWPNLLDRCKALGIEDTYRLFYHQLSAQPHADAEDLLNELSLAGLPREEFQERLAVETVEFSWCLTQAGLDAYFRAAGQLSVELGVGAASELGLCACADLVGLELIPREEDRSCGEADDLGGQGRHE